MIKLLIKHTIADYTISVFFNQVYDNFVKPPMSTVDRIRFLSQKISTRSRKISANYTVEMQQDITAFHGTDINSLLYDIMKREFELGQAVVGIDCGVAGGDYSVGYKGHAHGDSAIIFSPYVH